MSLYSYIYKKQSVLTHDQRVIRILFHSLAATFSLILVLVSSLLLNNLKSSFASPISAQISTNEQSTPLRPTGYAGQAIEQFNNLTISPIPSPTPTPLAPNEVLSERSPSGLSLRVEDESKDEVGLLFPTKSLYTIAIIGDSMVDTMGEVLEYLDAALKQKYPNGNFLLYNYGTGAQNIEMGLARFGSHFKYQSRDYQSLPELKPDILIVASFSYNPFTPHDRDRHWLTLTQLVQQAKSVSSNIYLLAEIAPLRANFSKGPQGVNWSDDTNYEHSGRIIEQLQNAIGLAKSLNVPLIDAFTPSFNSSSQEGNRSYVNPSDGIHPSVVGHQFMAEKIAQTIQLPF